MFQIWLAKKENKSNQSLKIFYANKEVEFISAKLKDIYNKKTS